MNNRFYLTIAFLLVILNAQAQTTRYVNKSASGANNGSSWTDAYTDLQTAIAASTAGDILWIAEGVYTPHASDRNVSFSINGLTLIGGFAGGETSATERDVINNPTVLSGDLLGDDLTNGTKAENSYHVVIIQTTGNSAVLDGLIISGGNADGAPGDPRLGGGIKISDGTANTTVNIRNCIIKNNYAFNGAGLYAYSTNYTHTVTVENTLFRDNIREIYGSAIYKFWKINLTVTNCSFISSTATLYNNGSTGSFVVNNSLFQTQTPTYITGDNSGVYTFNYCLFPDDPSSNTSITTFTNNLVNKDALLTGDDQLGSGSPAIDAGDKSLLLLTEDLAGNTRVINGSIDIGAFEYSAPTSTTGMLSGSLIAISVNQDNDWVLVKVAEDIVVNSYQLYTIEGVEHLRDRSVDDNEFKVNLNGVSTGLYILRLETSKGSFSTRIIKN